MLLLDVALYSCCVLLIAVMKFSETKRAVDLLIFFVIPLMHLAYGIAEWVEVFRPNRDLSEG